MTGLYRTDTEALDECLCLMFPDLEPDDFRTDGGNINMPKVRSLWRERSVPDMPADRALMLKLASRFGVCVGKGVGGDPYVGRPGTKDFLLSYQEGDNPAAAELMAVIRAVVKVAGSAVPSGVIETSAEAQQARNGGQG